MKSKALIIEELSERIRAHTWRPDNGHRAIPTGITAIDNELRYGGLISGACHEVVATHEGASLGFVLFLLSSIIKAKGPALWCSQHNELYTPGFGQFGIKDSDIIFINTNNLKESLWAAEQGLSCSMSGAVVIECQGISLAVGRRLKLLAQQHGTLAILLNKTPLKRLQATAASTRWHVVPEPASALPSRDTHAVIGDAHLTINLLRNVFGKSPLMFKVRFDEETLRFHSLPQLSSSTSMHHAQAITPRGDKKAA